MTIVTYADIARPQAEVFAYATDPSREITEIKPPRDWASHGLDGPIREAPRSCQKLKQRPESAS